MMASLSNFANSSLDNSTSTVRKIHQRATPLLCSRVSRWCRARRLSSNSWMVQPMWSNISTVECAKIIRCRHWSRSQVKIVRNPLCLEQPRALPPWTSPSRTWSKIRRKSQSHKQPRLKRRLIRLTWNPSLCMSQSRRRNKSQRSWTRIWRLGLHMHKIKKFSISWQGLAPFQRLSSWRPSRRCLTGKALEKVLWNCHIIRQSLELSRRGPKIFYGKCLPFQILMKSYLRKVVPRCNSALSASTYLVSIRLQTTSIQGHGHELPQRRLRNFAKLTSLMIASLSHIPKLGNHSGKWIKMPTISTTSTTKQRMGSNIMISHMTKCHLVSLLSVIWVLHSSQSQSIGPNMAWSMPPHRNKRVSQMCVFVWSAKISLVSTRSRPQLPWLGKLIVTWRVRMGTHTCQTHGASTWLLSGSTSSWP